MLLYMVGLGFSTQRVVVLCDYSSLWCGYCLIVCFRQYGCVLFDMVVLFCNRLCLE
jgi:hypothetical protein